MSNLFKDMFMNVMMNYARKDEKDPWDDYTELLQKPSVMDKIIEVLKQESEERKDQRIRHQQQEQKAYENQRAKRIRDNKKKHGIAINQEEEKEEQKENMKQERRKIKDYPRLNNLYEKVLEKHEDKEVSFFDFNPPVEGTKFDIGMFGGSVFIPLTHINNLGELPIYIKNYSEQVVKQIVDNVPGSIQFNFDCYSKFFQFDSDFTKIHRDMPAFMKGSQIVDSPNQINDLIDKAVKDIMNFYDNIVVQKSGLTFSHGLALRIWYIKNESRNFKSKGKKGKKAGRSYFDHLKVLPCLTKSVRGADMSKYIVNIQNQDDLCFLYNIINTKFFSDVKKHHKYFRYERYYHMDIKMLQRDLRFHTLMMPLIKYPYGFNDLNVEADRILSKFYPETKGNITETMKLILGKLNNEYYKSCEEFKVKLNTSHLFPMSYQHADLIQQFEDLNHVSINILEFIPEVYEQNCKLKLHEDIWRHRYMTKKNINSTNVEDFHRKHINMIFITDYNDILYLYESKGEKLPVYKSHYIMIDDPIELASPWREKNSYMLQCVKCIKFHPACKKKTMTHEQCGEYNKKILLRHYEKNQCHFQESIYVMPKEEDRQLRYNKYFTAYAKKYCIYVDFETLNVKSGKIEKHWIKADDLDFKENILLTNHVLVSARYIVHATDSLCKTDFTDQYHGKSEQFIDNDPQVVLNKLLFALTTLTTELSIEIMRKTTIDESSLTEEDIIRLNGQTKCFVCNNEFKDAKDRHKHHDHSKEKNNIVGYACQRCNQQMTDPQRQGIPILFHNGAKYDWKIILKGIGNFIEKYPQSNKDEIKPLALSSENFITFRWRDMIFLDSIKFMSNSLSEIVKTLTPQQMEIAKDLYRRNGITDDKMIDILSRKNVFPYLWFDSYDKLNATSLPGEEHFEKNDKGENEDYDYAIKAWNILKCKTFKDYHDMYLLADVVLLAACFQAFRETVYDKYRSDPAYYIGLPGLSWSLAMKTCSKVIELINNQEDYLVFQESLQGGIVQVCQRYAKKTDKNLIHYFDANGLYATILEKKKLPYKLIDKKMYDFAYEGLNEFSERKIEELVRKNEHCYFFIVDAEFQREYMDRYPGIKDLPFFPQKITVNEKMLSDMQNRQTKKYELKNNDTEKLAVTWNKTENYLVHMELLLMALRNGYKLTGIHGYYKFEHDYIFADYIADNNNDKKQATIAGNEFKRELSKLLSNIIYGKTIQNVLHHKDFEVIQFNGWNQRSRLNAIKSIKYAHRISDHLMIVEKDKSRTSLNMPIFIGKAVLDLSKAHMYDFFHNCFMRHYKTGRLIYMDTDSFILEIPDTEKGFNDFVLKNKNRFDFKGFDNPKYPYYDELQKIKKQVEDEIREDLPELEDDKKSWDKKVNTLYEIKIGCGEPGLFKSETKWASLTEFVALRPKQYSFIDEYGKKSMKSKGINKKAVKLHISHQQMVDQVLKDVAEVGCKMDHFVSKKCDMYLEYVYKRALINYEDKRYWLDSIYSLPYGHPWIEDIISKRSTVNNVVKKLQGDDQYEYVLNAQKYDEMRQEVKSNEANMSFSRLDEKIEIINNVCKTEVNKDELTLIKDNPAVMSILNRFNDDEDFVEEF